MTQNYQQLSYWLDSLPEPIVPRAKLSTMVNADVAIIGAGYSGLWTAYYLKQNDPSLNIVILEAQVAGFGASGRNGGSCSAYISGMGQWIKDPQTRDAALRLQKLMFENVGQIGEVCQKESIDCDFDLSGSLEIAVNRTQVQRLQSNLDYYRNLGFGDDCFQWLDQDQLSQKIHFSNAKAALHVKRNAALHPARLVRGLADKLEAMGVKIFEQSAVIDIQPKHVQCVEGQVRAEVIIMATEAYSNSIADLKGQVIPLHSMMVATEPLSDKQIAQLNISQRHCFSSYHHMVTYGQLTADKRITFGCRGNYCFASGMSQFHADNSDFKRVRKTLLEFFPSLEGIEFSHAWGGAMGVSRELRPSITFNPKSGLGWAGGFFGGGIGATHLAGRTLADLVVGRDTERCHTPWVNPPDAASIWEPEPFRWLGIRSAKFFMQLADRCEQRNSRFTPLVQTALNQFLL